MKKNIFLLLIAIIATINMKSEDIKIKYPDGSYKISKDNGRTWERYKAPDIIFKYENFSKISSDNGKTWKRVIDTEEMRGFIVSEDFIFIDQMTDKIPIRYKLLDSEGTTVELDNITTEYIQFKSDYSGLHFIVLEYDDEKTIFKLLF
jgi:hypothetical protein